MTQKDLYEALNESVTQQKNPLTQSQIVFLLKKNPEYIPLLEQVTDQLNKAQAESPEAYAIYLAQVKNQLKSIVQTPEFAEKLAQYESPSQPLNMDLPGGAPGFKTMRLFVNHPVLKDPNNPRSPVLPAQDLRKLVIDFIKGAEQEIWYNVFDFDLKDIATALKNQHQKKNVRVTGGIDAGTIAARPEVQAIFDQLAALESDTFRTIAVKSVGLNHQKILPPNANHALLVVGSLPAQVTKAELKKTLEAKIRGQSQYPISGSYRIYGDKRPGQSEVPSITISFSPNGGEGDVNKSIYVPLIQSSKGSIEAVHFCKVRSARPRPFTKNAIIALRTAARQKPLPRFIIKFSSSPRTTRPFWAPRSIPVKTPKATTSRSWS